jgi:hypothetical protein
MRSPASLRASESALLHGSGGSPPVFPRATLGVYAFQQSLYRERPVRRRGCGLLATGKCPAHWPDHKSRFVTCSPQAPFHRRGDSCRSLAWPARRNSARSKRPQASLRVRAQIAPRRGGRLPGAGSPRAGSHIPSIEQANGPLASARGAISGSCYSRALAR